MPPNQTNNCPPAPILKTEGPLGLTTALGADWLPVSSLKAAQVVLKFIGMVAAVEVWSSTVGRVRVKESSARLVPVIDHSPAKPAEVLGTILLIPGVTDPKTKLLEPNMLKLEITVAVACMTPIS